MTYPKHDRPLAWPSNSGARFRVQPAGNPSRARSLPISATKYVELRWHQTTRSRFEARVQGPTTAWSGRRQSRPGRASARSPSPRRYQTSDRTGRPGPSEAVMVRCAEAARLSPSCTAAWSVRGEAATSIQASPEATSRPDAATAARIRRRNRRGRNGTDAASSRAITSSTIEPTGQHRRGRAKQSSKLVRSHDTTSELGRTSARPEYADVQAVPQPPYGPARAVSSRCRRAAPAPRRPRPRTGFRGNEEHHDQPL